MVFELRGGTKSFGPVRALDDVSFSADEGDIVSVIGPSASGKTTLLKILAGLETQDAGSVEFRHPDIETHPRILVFQDYVLFPHMTVFENMAFGLRARKSMKRETIKIRVHEMLEYFGIADQRSKYPIQLSGGQQQRVAIGRAMIVNPHILLLDEPFANLDSNLKLETADFIRRTQKEFNVTTIAVTHDLEEAFALSDKIGILLDGRMAQFGTAEQIYFHPADIDTAKFLGPVNVIPTATLKAITVNCTLPEGARSCLARAEGLELRLDENGNGRIAAQRFTGRMILYEVIVGGTLLKVFSLSSSYSPGDCVEVILNRFSLL